MASCFSFGNLAETEGIHMTSITLNPEQHNSRNVLTTTTHQNTADPLPKNSESRSIDLATLEQRLGEYLLLDDPDALAVVLGTVAAFRLGLHLVWLLIVGPPSGSKTELVSLLSKLGEAYPLSDLTENTFASGWEAEDGKDKSLLPELKDKILIFKDFTTVLSQKSERRMAVLGQLREIYDGQFVKAWGTGVRKSWEGRVGLIAGVTEAIDKEHSVMAQLGPRFVLFRLHQADRRKIALRALHNSQSPDQSVRDSLARDVARFVAALPITSPQSTEDQLIRLVTVADLATRARSAVDRDGSSRQLVHTPQPEIPARLGKQLHALTQGIAAVRGHGETSEQDVRTTCRVALDSIPAMRRTLLNALAQSDKPLAQTEVLQRVPGSSLTTVHRTLEELEALGVVTQDNQRWTLPVEFRELLIGAIPLMAETEAAAA